MCDPARIYPSLPEYTPFATTRPICDSMAAFPLTRLNGRAGERARSAARQKPFHWRVETRTNAQERAGDVVTLFQTVPGTCRPIHEVQFSRNAVL